MSNKLNDILSNLSKLVKEDSSEINKLLNNIGISKENALKKIEDFNENQIIKELNDEEIESKIENLSEDNVKKLNDIKNYINEKKKKE